MSRYEKIKNIVICANLTNTPVSFNQNTNIAWIPDEIIVRQISYQGPMGPDGVFLVWCSLHNDYIGSFTLNENSSDVTSSSISYPNTLIRCLPNNPNQTLTFQIHTINSTGNPVPISSSNINANANMVSGSLVIHLDYCKYVN